MPPCRNVSDVAESEPDTRARTSRKDAVRAIAISTLCIKPVCFKQAACQYCVRPVCFTSRGIRLSSGLWLCDKPMHWPQTLLHQRECWIFYTQISLLVQFDPSQYQCLRYVIDESVYRCCYDLGGKIDKHYVIYKGITLELKLSCKSLPLKQDCYLFNKYRCIERNHLLS